MGKKGANSWGLHDMSGNVYEWVQDGWHDNYDGAPTDGSAWEGKADGRGVLRGGSWLDDPRGARGVARGRILPQLRGRNGGFRLARTFPF